MGATAFGALVQRYRRVAGLTQEELAERSGYSVSHIRKLEQGTRIPTPRTVDDLADALELSEEVRPALYEARAHDIGAAGTNGKFAKLPRPLTTLLDRIQNVAETKLPIPRRWIIALLTMFGVLLGLLALLCVLIAILVFRDLTQTPSPTGPLAAAKPVIPGGLWISPRNGQRFTDSSIHFAAHAYPTNPGDPPIKYVIFTAWWRSAGASPWPKVCWVRKPSDADVYSCTWHFHWHSRPVPTGPIRISFDVYDRRGDRNLAPNGVHTIYYSPRPARTP